MSSSFSKDQISRILSKASQIQARMDRMGDAEGLNESELFQLGAEVGLSKQAILESINDLSNSEQLTKKFNWFSGSSQLQFDQVLFGELSEVDKDAIIGEIRSATGGIGKVNAPSLNQLEWEQRRSEIGYKHITLSSEEHGRIRLRYNYNWGGLKLGLSVIAPTLAMAFFVIIGKGLGLNEYKGLFVLGGLISGLIGGRIYLKTYFEEQKAKFEQLKKRLTKVLKTNKPKTPNTHEHSSVNKPLLDHVIDEPNSQVDENPSMGLTRAKN